MAATTARSLPRGSARLTFAWWRSGDLPLALSLWGDPAVTRLIDARSRWTPDDVRARLAAEIAHGAAHGMQYWPIFLRDGGTFVGCAGLRPFRPGMPELGFHIRTGMAGRGLATEAARAVIEHAFDDRGPNALFAGHNPDNVASRRILAKLGFSHTHDELYPPTGREHPCYRLEAPRTLVH